MRTLRGEFLEKLATVTVGAAVLTGCSSAMERFGEAPIYTGSTQNQRAILSGESAEQPSYQDIIDGPGGTSAGLPQSSAVPVTTGSISQTQQPVQSAPLPAPTYVAPVASAPKVQPVMTLPAPETASTSAVANARSWKGWTSAGGTKVQLRQGDTLNSVSRRYGVPIQAVAAVNGIQDPSAVKPGQTIIIPTYVFSDRNGTTSATEGETGSVKLPKVANADTLTTGSIPTVAGTAPDRKPKSQPTFADISKSKATVQKAKVAQIDTSPKRKPAGHVETLTTASIPSPTNSGSVPTPRKPPKLPKVLEATPTKPVETTELPAPSNLDEARPTAPIKTPQIVASVQPEETTAPAKFRWPVRGRIISDFGAKPGGGRNEGVNLAVPEGTPVKAADDGSVIYSGNELKGYGNLVLVRHEDGWVSAYAHNSQLKVKRGDKVRRGDTIGLAGATGSVTQPQVHFELRRGNKPVDPLNHLPPR
ncbi:MAG: peptidoglycan DD-metalloendopeptidase family protein [Roseibium sp.]